MQRKMSLWRGVGVLAAVAVLAGFAPAQTQGMERRNDRAGARAAKQTCIAGNEKSRAECRQVKRQAKQAGRNDKGSNTNAAPAPNTAQ